MIVAAASSLRPSLSPGLVRWGQSHGIEIQLVYGASGSLVQQLRRGAPFAVFVSASPAYLEPLRTGGRLCGAPLTLGEGRLALYLPNGSPVPLQADLTGLDRVRRLALANPRIAPFGALARQALRRAGLWPRLQARVVLGESAAQAGRFALSGAVDAALLPERLVRQPPFSRRGRWVAVMPTLYTPTPIQAVRLCPSPQAAEAVLQALPALFGER